MDAFVQEDRVDDMPGRRFEAERHVGNPEDRVDSGQFRFDSLQCLEGGEAIAANKVKGVRCAVCWTHETAELSRRHNNANVLSIGERMISLELALEIVDIWLDTPFDGGRHARRIQELDCYEAGGGDKGMLAVLERKTAV